MSKTLRWGILGTGRIAEKFATQLSGSDSGQLIAVGSRDPSRQPYWCDDVPVMTYAAVVDHPDVDAVYIGLPNGLHKEWTLRSLHAHKHVLCEKPLACSPEDAAAMFAAATSHQRILVEAFMYRCQPAIQDALRLIHEGAIGEVRTLRGSFSFEHRLQPHDPRWEVGQGGSLFDVGCYPVQLMNAIMNAEPERVEASLVNAQPGVDSSGAALLHYPSGAAGVITFGMEIGGDRSFQVCGTRGSIKFEDPWLNGNEFTWQHDHGTEVHSNFPEKGLYSLEADAFAAAVHGELEPWISEVESMRSARTLAAVRSAAE